MRLVRNNGYIRSRKRRARLTAFLGFVFLASAVAITFLYPALFIPGYALLILGFITFNMGMQQTTKWSRHPRPDEVLVETLRRLNDRYTLIHYPAVGRGKPSHVLVYPGGLIVITTREVPGTVTVDGPKWRRSGGNKLWMLVGMSAPQLGNPAVENEGDRKALEAILDEHGLSGGDTIDGLVAFLNPQVDLQVESSDLTVVDRDNLLRAVRELSSETVLPTKERELIIGVLSEGKDVEGPVSLATRTAGAKRARAA
ncbi:MAG TPA: nuclease-related domain-containing protein [Nitrolancea sp.]|nr:nuclease-related domain-containing protein [Nitrolancea sp.]